MHIHVNDKWLCQNTARLSQIWRDTNFLTRQQWRGRSIKYSKVQCSSFSVIDLILMSMYHTAVLWQSWYAIFVYSVWQLTFSRNDAKSSSGGICDSGRNALIGCHGDFQVFSMTLFMLINQTVLSYNVQWQLHVLFIGVYSNKRFLTSELVLTAHGVQDMNQQNEFENYIIEIIATSPGTYD